MKKNVLKVMSITLCIGVMFLMIHLIINICCPNNENIVVGIRDISVKSDLHEFPLYETIFSAHNWPDELKAKVEKDIDSYTMISVVYCIKNLSENITMKDVRFYPKFADELNNMLEFYNSDNGTYYLYAKPELGTGMTQYFLINANKKSKDEILQTLKEQEVEMTYYTGSFSINTGHGLTGIGKQKYRFKIQEAINVYKENVDLFN